MPAGVQFGPQVGAAEAGEGAQRLQAVAGVVGGAEQVIQIEGAVTTDHRSEPRLVCSGLLLAAAAQTLGAGLPDGFRFLAAGGAFAVCAGRGPGEFAAARQGVTGLQAGAQVLRVVAVAVGLAGGDLC